MDKIISVNAGSSSLKFQLIEMPSEQVLTSGQAERIGQDMGVFTIKVNGEKIVKELPIKAHDVAVKLLLDSLLEYKVVESLDEITGAGHRIVQGGDLFECSVIVDDEVEKKVESLCDLAPLHNPAHLVGYRAFKDAMPNIKHVFVFDTAFHQTMTEESFMYAVPLKWYTDYSVRRYGAHGTSHQYVSQRVAELMNRKDDDFKVITCHLGNGASVSAIKGGKCVNTSMGFTPLAGLMMGTRSGDIDPAIIPYVMEKTGKTANEIVTALNKESGMLGVSGISSDARDIEAAVKEGNKNAILTTNLYVNRVVNTVGGYYAQLRGLDAIVFTAGLGENDGLLRQKICDVLAPTMGIVLDEEVNLSSRGKETLLTKPESKVQVWLIPTNEELMIARDTYNLIHA